VSDRLASVQEGQRTDAAFDDPLASILVGDRGRAIARCIPRAPMIEWGETGKAIAPPFNTSCQ